MIGSFPRRLNLANPVNRSAALNQGLVGWWMSCPSGRPTYGSRMQDMLGYGTHLIHYGCVLTGPPIPGRSSPTLSFNGSSDQASIAATARLQLTSSFTLACWVRLTGLPSAGHYISLIGTDAGDARGGYHFWINDGGGVQLYVSSSGTVTSTNLSLNTWYHIAATHSDEYNWATIAVNGEVVAAGSSTDNPPGGGSFLIGYPGWSLWDEYFEGQCDDIRVYNRAIGLWSYSDFKQLYDASRHNYPNELNWSNGLTLLGAQGSSASTIIGSRLSAGMQTLSGGIS